MMHRSDPSTHLTRAAALRLLPMLVAALLGTPCAPAVTTPEATAQGSQLMPLDTGTVRIDTPAGSHRVRVEIARTERERRPGLMLRSSLPEDAGMLFVFDETQGPEDGFYMYRTQIPLDIAFIGSDGGIVAIRQMEPCRARIAALCRSYRPGAPYVRALEVNGGYFAARAIVPGDRVTLLEEES